MGAEKNVTASAESRGLWFRVNRGEPFVIAGHCNVPTAEESTQTVEGMATSTT